MVNDTAAGRKLGGIFLSSVWHGLLKCGVDEFSRLGFCLCCSRYDTNVNHGLSKCALAYWVQNFYLVTFVVYTAFFFSLFPLRFCVSPPPCFLFSSNGPLGLDKIPDWAVVSYSAFGKLFYDCKKKDQFVLVLGRMKRGSLKRGRQQFGGVWWFFWVSPRVWMDSRCVVLHDGNGGEGWAIGRRRGRRQVKREFIGWPHFYYCSCVLH